MFMVYTHIFYILEGGGGGGVVGVFNKLTGQTKHKFV